MRCFPPEWMEICLRGCPSRMNKQMMLLLLTIEEHLDTHANVDVVKLLAQNMKRELHLGRARLPVVFCQVVLTPRR